MYYNLFLDDERGPLMVKWVDLPPVQWTIVRNYQSFVDTITKNGLPAHVSFDHDLASEHYPFVNGKYIVDEKEPIPYDTYKEKTGYHCALWLIDYCRQRKLKLPHYYVHSMNVVGKQNILQIFHAFHREQHQQQ